MQQQWGPGPLIGGVGASDQSSYRVFKIRSGDGPSSPDYAGWPTSLGAPGNPNGTPLLLGNTTLWSVCNDRSPLAEANPAGTAGIDAAHSLGIEIQQTTFASSGPWPLDNVLYFKYRLLNKGLNHLHQTYLGIWADPDLGDASDDLAGCDSAV